MVMGVFGSRRRRGAAGEALAGPVPTEAGPEHAAPADAPWSSLDNPEGLPVIGARRAGRYVVRDADGELIGSIRGDYVIGFTVQCWGQTFRVKDLTEAAAEIAAQARRRQSSLRSRWKTK